MPPTHTSRLSSLRARLNRILVRQLVLYGVIGVTAAGLDFLVFTLLTNWGWAVLLANLISVNLGIATSFLLNAYFNFQRTDRLGRRAAMFFMVGWTGLALSTGILYLGVHLLDRSATATKLVSIVFVALTQFALNKKITFRAVRKRPS